jgi:hypothetical protein
LTVEVKAKLIMFGYKLFDKSRYSLHISIVAKV